MKIYIISLLAGLLFNSALGNECNSKQDIESLLRDYQIQSMEQFRGGLTEELAASKWLNHTVTVNKKHFSHPKLTVVHPHYTLECIPAPKEGDLGDTQLIRFFYPYDTDYNETWLLRVIDRNLDKEVYRFEVVGNQLWDTRDGWLYRLTPKE